MTTVRTCTTIAGVLAGAIAWIGVACRPEVAPVRPLPREVPPLASPPEPTPAAAAERAPLPSCEGLTACPDGGLSKPEPLRPIGTVNPGPTSEADPTAVRLLADNGAIDEKKLPRPSSGSGVPAGIPPRLDAGIDATVSLPPVPDAGVLRDAGQPMR